MYDDNGSYRMGEDARGFTREERKEIVKEALKEWLDEKMSAFGRWSLMTLGALFIAGIGYFVLWAHGWSR